MLKENVILWSSNDRTFVIVLQLIDSLLKEKHHLNNGFYNIFLKKRKHIEYVDNAFMNDKNILTLNNQANC